MPAIFCPRQHGMPAPTPWFTTFFERRQKRRLSEPIFEDRTPPEREELGAFEQAPQEDNSSAASLDLFASGQGGCQAQGPSGPGGL